MTVALPVVKNVTRGYGARLPNGRLVEPGITKLVYHASFALGEDLPSWLSVPSGQGTAESFASAANRNGMLRVSSAAALDAFARLRGPVIFPGRYRAIEWVAHGLQVGAEGQDPWPGDFFMQLRDLGGSAAGWSIRNTTTESPASSPHMRGTIAGSSPEVTWPIRETIRHQGENYRRRNLGMRWYIADKQAVVFEDDCEHGERAFFDLDGLGVGTVNSITPEISVRSKSTATPGTSFSVAAVTLTLWQN